jgi:hypothetical protein
MSVSGAMKKVNNFMIELNGITASPHKFGGIEYKLGKREIGHIHGNNLVDIPFPMKIRNEVIEDGEAEPHHILPESGWVSIFLYTENDLDKAIRLLKRSYDLAIGQIKKREVKI